MHHAHAGNNGEVVAVEIEVDLILDKAAEGVAAAVCLRLHDLAVNAGDRRLAERPLGFAGAGVETGAQIVAAQGFRQRGLQAPGVGIVVRVHLLHSAGDAVRHISPVMGFGMLVVDFCGDAVEVVVHRRPVILQAQAPAPGLAGLVGGADGAVAAGVPGIVVGVVGFMVIVEGAGQLVLIVRLPDPGGQKSIGVPVRRVGVDGAAVVFGFLAVTAAIDQNPAQELIAAGDGHPVVPAAIRRVVTAAVAEGAGLARAQVIIRRFRAEGDIPPDSAVGRFRRGGAGLDIHAAVHIGVDIIAADAEGVEPGATDVAAAGGVGLGDTVHVDADAVALHTANVVAGVTSAVEAAFAVAGAAAGPGGADERLIAHD